MSSDAPTVKPGEPSPTKRQRIPALTADERADVDREMAS